MLVVWSYTAQITLPRVELMPNIPQPFQMRNWKQVALDYDAFVFNFNTTGQYLPLIWWDRTSTNYKRVVFGQPSYVGWPASWTTRNNHESINCMGAVLGATLIGIDKSNQNGMNWVIMQENYFNKDNGENLVLNRSNTTTGQSFWYEIFPNILFYQLAYYYPSLGTTDNMFYTIANRWYLASYFMGGNSGIPNYDHTAFRFSTLTPVDNGLWKEPDAAAGIAWLGYMAYVKSGKTLYTGLTTADWGMQFLHNRITNPFYECLLPYGAYLAARMNAELGRNYNLEKFLNWCLCYSSDARPYFGVIADTWAGYDVHGLIGGNTDGGGYGFAMNTYHMAGALVPIVRYDDRYARAIGKWMLNAANASRFFYANSLDSAHQSSKAWADVYDPNYCIGYEGFRKYGRKQVLVDSDYLHRYGTIESGNYINTQQYQTDNQYEVLKEAVVGSNDQLEHIWDMTLPVGTSHTILVNAYYSDGGDSDSGFVFSYSTSTAGPFITLFTISNSSPSQLRWNSLPSNLSGRIYIRVQDNNRTGGNTMLDTLYIDAIFVMSELSVSPYSMGDGISGYPYGVKTDFGLYGSAHVGIFGGIISTTNNQYILQLDCLKTDYYHDSAYPTYLYYNPFSTATSVQIDVGTSPKDLWDCVSNTFLRQNVTGVTYFSIPADSAVVLVLAPANGTKTMQGSKLLINGVVVDYLVPATVENWDRHQ
ncbi:MAG: hypothetical protein N3A72_08015 [bacterium]|nr:hypothetical protein [bacterium]